MFQAGAIYEGQCFLGTSIARPLIAKRMVEIARAESAEAIAAYTRLQAAPFCTSPIGKWKH